MCALAKQSPFIHARPLRTSPFTATPRSANTHGPPQRPTPNHQVYLPSARRVKNPQQTAYASKVNAEGNRFESHRIWCEVQPFSPSRHLRHLESVRFQNFSYLCSQSNRRKRLLQKCGRFIETMTMNQRVVRITRHKEHCHLWPQLANTLCNLASAHSR